VRDSTRIGAEVDPWESFSDEDFIDDVVGERKIVSRGQIMKPINRIEYREISLAAGGLSSDAPLLADLVSEHAQEHEEQIAGYLESAPNYSAMGKVVGDALNLRNKVLLFPGSNSDGIFCWQTELAYYVRTYHVRLPPEFIERMRSRNWRPPKEEEINWENLHRGWATEVEPSS
jgi:hypothetical protein